MQGLCQKVFRARCTPWRVSNQIRMGNEYRSVQCSTPCIFIQHWVPSSICTVLGNRPLTGLCCYCGQEQQNMVNVNAAHGRTTVLSRGPGCGLQVLRSHLRVCKWRFHMAEFSTHSCLSVNDFRRHQALSVLTTAPLLKDDASKHSSTTLSDFQKPSIGASELFWLPVGLGSDLPGYRCLVDMWSMTRRFSTAW